MQHSSDEPEWVEEIVIARYPKGTRLDSSRDTEGALRGTLRDSENRLVGGAQFFRTSQEDQSRDDDTDDDHNYEYDYDDADYDIDFGDEEGSGLAGLAVIGLTIGAVAGARYLWNRRQTRKAEESEVVPLVASEPRTANAPPGMYVDPSGVRRWWDGQNWGEQVHSDHRNAPADWYHDGHGAIRWWDGTRWTEHVQNQVQPHASHASFVHGQGQQVQSYESLAGVRMTKEEWRERTRMMLMARSFSELQWQILSQAVIEDADEALLDWQKELRQLSPQEFSNRINDLLATNAQVRQSALAYVERAEVHDHWGRVSARVPGERPQVTSGGQVLPKTPGWFDDGTGAIRHWNGSAWSDYTL